MFVYLKFLVFFYFAGGRKGNPPPGPLALDPPWVPDIRAGRMPEATPKKRPKKRRNHDGRRHAVSIQKRKQAKSG